MNKRDRQEIESAERAAALPGGVGRDYAASTLCLMHRCARKADQTIIADKLKTLGLTDLIRIVNGCLVTKESTS